MSIWRMSCHTRSIPETWQGIEVEARWDYAAGSSDLLGLIGRDSPATEERA